MRINRMGGDVELLRYFPVSRAESHQACTIQGRGRAPPPHQACCPAGLMGPRAPMRASGPEIPHRDRAVSARAAATRGPWLGEVITELRTVEDQHLVTEVGCYAEHSAERAHICAQSPHLRVNSTARRLPVRLLVDGRPAHQDQRTYQRLSGVVCVSCLLDGCFCDVDMSRPRFREWPVPVSLRLGGRFAAERPP